MLKRSILLVIGFFIGWHSANAQQISSISPKEIIGGTSEILTIKGSGFGASRGTSFVSFFVEGDIYTDATTGATFNYTNWSDSEIKLEMPVAFSNKVKVVIGGNDVFSADILKVMANLGYREVNPLVYDLLIDKNNAGGITWYVHPTFWNNAEIKQAIADVVQEFRCKTGVNYVIEPLTKTVPLSLDEGLHIIAPDENLNVVGYNAKKWSSCILGAETFYFSETQLLQFDTDQTWYYGQGQAPAGTSKFRYVLFHEMGHSLGLGHVNEEGQSMYPSVNFLPSDNWSSRDTITNAEKIAIQYFVSLSQNFSFRGCGINPIATIDNCENVYGQSAGSSDYTRSINALVYPNPASSSFNIKVPAAAQGINAILRLYDYQGKICMNQIISDTEDIKIPSTLSNGLYYVTLTTDNQLFNAKMMVQKQ